MGLPCPHAVGQLRVEHRERGHFDGREDWIDGLGGAGCAVAACSGGLTRSVRRIWTVALQNKPPADALPQGPVGLDVLGQGHRVVQRRLRPRLLRIDVGERAVQQAGPLPA